MKFYIKLREKSKFLPIFSAQMFNGFGLVDFACFGGVFIRQKIYLSSYTRSIKLHIFSHVIKNDFCYSKKKRFSLWASICTDWRSNSP